MHKADKIAGGATHPEVVKDLIKIVMDKYHRNLEKTARKIGGRAAKAFIFLPYASVIAAAEAGYILGSVADGLSDNVGRAVHVGYAGSGTAVRTRRRTRNCKPLHSADVLRRITGIKHRTRELQHR